VGEVVPSYVWSINERGRRRRNKRFQRGRRGARWRRRRSRKRRVRFRWGSWGSSERKGGGDKSGRDNMRGHRSEIGRGWGRNVRLDDESRKNGLKGMGQLEG
jgi:hypothetical protein